MLEEVEMHRARAASFRASHHEVQAGAEICPGHELRWVHVHLFQSTNEAEKCFWAMLHGWYLENINGIYGIWYMGLLMGLLMGLFMGSLYIYIYMIVDRWSGWWLTYPLWQIWVPQLGWWNSQYMEKIKKKCSKPPTRYYMYVNIYIYTYYDTNSKTSMVESSFQDQWGNMLEVQDIYIYRVIWVFSY